jgi:two-component system chemotaxis sensor kinase CheA
VSTFDVNEFLAGYLAEVEDHLKSARTHIGEVEASLRERRANPRAIRELFRSLHTIKGLSGMVGADPVVDLAHAMETVFRAAERAAGRLPPQSLDLLVQALAAIEQRVAALAQGKPLAPAPAGLIGALEALPSASGEAAEAERLALDPALAAKLGAAEKQELALGVARGQRALRLDFRPSAERAAAGLTITTVQQNLARLGQVVKVVPLSMPPSDTAPAGLVFAILLLTAGDAAAVAEAAGVAPRDVTPIAGEAPAALPAAPEDEGPALEPARAGVIRVEVARLDDALEKLSALVVNRFRLETALAALQEKGVDLRQVLPILKENRRQLRDMRAAIMRARMISVADMLDRVPLIVRGLSRTSGKPLRVEVSAGRAELDKSVADRLFPAIVHLLRNAVDHGIEPPEARARAGKPAEGTLRVVCEERSNNQLELTVSDDGRGVDRAAAAARAGRETPAGDAALLDLLALPGLSTLEQATTTSGRGMGMNIVRQVAVEQLGGQLEVRSVPGEGTTFAMRVPLSITIVDAFSFEAGAQRFATPVSSVDEIVELAPERLVAAPSPAGGLAARLVERRGEAIPLVALDTLFALPGATGAGRKAMVVRRQGRPFAFGVDRMLGQQEVVVRPLEDPLVRAPGVTGSTDLGDGRPTLVIDLVALSGVLGEAQGESAR